MKILLYSIILFFFTATTLGWLHSTNVKHREDNEKQYYSAQEAITQALTACYQAKSSIPKDCERYAEKSKKIDLAAHDLLAQKQMSHNAFLNTLMAGVTLIFLVATTLFAWGAWNAGRSAVTVTREMGVAQIRAYLTIDKPELFFDDDKQLSITLPVKHLGQTPAFNVVLKCNIEVYTNNPPESSIVHRDEHEETVGTIPNAGNRVFKFKDVDKFKKDKRIRVTFTTIYSDVFSLNNLKRGQWEHKQARIEFLSKVPTRTLNAESIQFENMTTSERLIS